MWKIVFVIWFQIPLQEARPCGQPVLPRLSTLSLCLCSSLQMMQFAWQSYKRYAMGKNELRPLTRDGYEGNMFGELTSGEALPLGAEQYPCSGTVLLLAFSPPEWCPSFSRPGGS